jgi:hypothetical protein
VVIMVAWSLIEGLADSIDQSMADDRMTGA